MSSTQRLRTRTYQVDIGNMIEEQVPYENLEVTARIHH
jgi:hypothetical protein